MKLINTNGMAFIGPGSEWFWSAFSGLVLAVTFLAIYRQLKVQRDREAIDQLDELLREWSSERLARAKLAILLALRAGVETERLPSRPISHVGFFWNRIGHLVRTGHMDGPQVYVQLGNQLQWWWAALTPAIILDRTGQGDPTGWAQFEWLAREAAAFDAKRGVVREYGPEGLAADFDPWIEAFTQAVEMEEALRTVTVRVTPSPLPVRPERQPATPAAQPAE